MPESPPPVDADDPPPIPPAEMPRQELSRILDEGDVAAVERALREQNVRLPDVLEELDRVLARGHGNLAASLVTMLVSSFHVARSDLLTERVLVHRDTAGTEELVDLAAALLQQERVDTAGRVLDAAREAEPKHDRALYLCARIYARRGRTNEAFATIAHVNPSVLGPSGLLIQARYALFSGKNQAAESAIRLAAASQDEAVATESLELERARDRIRNAGLGDDLLRSALDLRSAIALEYGSLLVELDQDPSDGGRFGVAPMELGDAGRIVDRILDAVKQLGLPLAECVYATEDGEIVAAAISRRTGVPYGEWRADRAPSEGMWLCMASAATHPHLPNPAVKTLQNALDKGNLATLALVLPCGSRGPLVPDIVGRISADDDFPWTLDDEVTDVVDRIFLEESSGGHVRNDTAAFDSHLERVRAVLRVSQPRPRPKHAAFLDETPVPRARA